MSTYPSRLQAWHARAATFLLISVTAVLAALPFASAAGASAVPPRQTATATRATSRSVATAARRRTAADQALRTKDKGLEQCLRRHPTHPKRCAAARRSIHQAAGRLAIAERRFSEVAHSTDPAVASRGDAGTSGPLDADSALPHSASVPTTAAIPDPGIPPVSLPSSPSPVEATQRPSDQPSANFEPGINAGWVYPGQLDMAAAKRLGAKLVRVEFPIEWTAAQLERTIAGYAEIGVRVAPLATFDGRLPTPSEAQSLATWARAYGPGGTFWAGRSDGRLAIQSIEFGNETSDGSQYGEASADEPSYTARAETYALRLKEAADAISASTIHVGLLAVTGDWTGNWMKGMFSAVPNFGSYVAGWVSHPYGANWRKTLEEVISQTAAHGAPGTIPIDVTEWGLASDNGLCLTENYGWNPCMSYQEAAETLRDVSAEMRQMLGGRLGMFVLYQSRDQQPSGTTSAREDYFGLLQHEGQPKGAYTEAAEEVLAS